jgi:hypothetical protein
MDIETTAERLRRLLSRRTIGCLLLLLIIFWNFDGAARVAPWAWRINNASTYISSVAIFKDIMVLNNKEQNTSMVLNNLTNFFLICLREPVSVFSGPIGRQCGSKIASALGDDVFYGFGQSVVNSKDDIAVIEIATQAGRYGRGEPVILEVVTKYGGINIFAGFLPCRPRSCAERDRWAAIHRIGCQPEAAQNGTNVGAQLVLFGVFRDIGLIPSGVREPVSRVNGSLGIDASVLHLSQLAIHGVPLQERSTEGTNTDKNKSGGPNYKPTSNPYQRGIVAALILCLGATLLGFAMKLGYKASETPWLIAPAIGLGIISAAVAIHGLWYACLGIWSLPGLYIF